MYKTFIRVYRDSIHIQVEIRWAPDLANALDAYVRFLNTPLLARHHDRSKQAETTRQYISRLIRSILRENGLVPAGEVIIAKMRLTAAQHLRCTFDFRHDFSSAAVPLRQSALYPETISPWPEPATASDIPSQIMRHGMHPEDRADMSPGTAAWENGAHNLLLHTLARAIARKQNIAIDEQALCAHLQELAGNTDAPDPELHTAQAKSDLLQGAIEHLLIKTVVTRYGF